MAMTYQNFASLGVNLNRQKYGPLDISNVFTSAADLKYYLTKGTFTEGVSEYWYKDKDNKIVPYPYEGQVLATVIDGVVSVYALSLDAEGNFQTQEIGVKIETDEKTIKLVNGKLELVGLPTDVSGKTFVPSLVNGVLTWAEPDTSTAEGQAQEIEGLKNRTTSLETTVNGKAAVGEEGAEGYVPAVVGLVDKVAALEAVDNATQAELDAYKEVVTAAIAAGVKEAKDYADAQDADTVYDDTELAGRVSAIESDYLKAVDKYDDTELAGRVTTIETDYLKKSDETIYDDTALVGRVTTVEGKVADLEAAVEAIDYVDADELATALEPYAKSDDVETALAGKADKTAFEELKGTVDAFLTGNGTEAALDSLKELIAYIDEHDGADLTEMVATIEGIEKKLEGIDDTVAAHVTAAIDALKIGDYAKAADLTALADRVAVLEAKPFDTYATKTEVSDVDAKFADYTTTSDLNSLLDDKADADSVVANDTFASFQETNTTAIATAKAEAIADAAKAVEEAGFAVASEVEATYATKDELTEAVEDIENDLLAYAKTADVNAELTKKIETATIAHATEEKAEGVTVNGTALNIVVDAYTKAETLAQIEEIMDQLTDSSENAATVAIKLDNHITAYTEKVGQIDSKNNEQDTAIAVAKAQADKGVADAAQVAIDLATANGLIADNTREIGVAKSSIETVNTTLTEKITALENADVTIKSDIVALQGVVSGTDGHASRIAALEGRATNLETKDTELLAAIQANTAKFDGYYTKGEVDSAVQAAIDKIPEVDFTGYATETYVTDAIAAVNAEVAKKADASALDNYYTKTDADAAFMTEGEVDTRINALINAADPEGGKVISDIQNLVKYVEENAGEIAGLVTTVGEHTTAIANNKTAHENNATAIAQNASDIAALVTSVAANEVKESSEISVAAVEGATGVQLSIKSVSTDKLVQGTDTLVLNGGSAV